jgi:segregation and condensation protein B
MMAKSKTASSEAVDQAVQEVPEEPDPTEGDEQDLASLDTERYLKGLIEALLFVTDRPLELKDLARATKIDRKRCAELLETVRADYAERGLRIDEVGGGYMFRTHPAYASYVQGFLAQRPIRLSRAQLETLSIVAYRQPITRPEIDDIRGVDCGPVLKGLLERDLVRILGKKDEPGRPMLYGTTQNFLELFSLQSLRDLPTLREFTELSEDSRRVFERELGEDAPEGPIEITDAEAKAANLATDDAAAATPGPEVEEGQQQPTADVAAGEDEDEDEDEEADEDDEDEDDEDEDDEDESDADEAADEDDEDDDEDEDEDEDEDDEDDDED